MIFIVDLNHWFKLNPPWERGRRLSWFGGWLHTEVVYLLTISHQSKY